MTADFVARNIDGRMVLRRFLFSAVGERDTLR